MPRKKIEKVASTDTTIDSPALAIQWTEQVVPVAKLKPYERNPRRISEKAFEKLKASLAESGYHQRITVNADLGVVGGHMRIRALKELGIREVPVLVPDRNLTEAEFRRILIQDNLPFGEFDFDELANGFDIDELVEWGFNEDQLVGLWPEEAGAAGGPGDAAARPTLADRFLIPPFSVLDARQGYWQDRKRQWLALGIKSEIGRGGVEGHGAAVPGDGGGQTPSTVKARASSMAMHNDPMQRKRRYDGA